VDLQRVLPRGFTVALEHVPRFQASVEAEPTWGLLDHPCTQSACVAGSNALYPCLELLRISNAHHLSLAAVAPLPLHSVRPKLAVRCKDSLRATLGTEWILHVGAPASRAKYQHFRLTKVASMPTDHRLLNHRRKTKRERERALILTLLALTAPSFLFLFLSPLPLRSQTAHGSRTSVICSSF